MWTRVRYVGPWSLSVVVHAGLILLGFTVTWSIIEHEERLESPIVSSDVPIQSPLMALRPLPEMSNPTPEMPMVPEQPTSLVADSQPIVAGPIGAVTKLAPPSLAFAGTGLESAREVVFVIDASGSMTAWLPFVIDELERTLSHMRDSQWFAVVCFAGENLYVTPRSGLTAVTEESARTAIEDLRSTINDLVGGGSDPTMALREAMAMRPELVMLLSEGLDGRGRFAADESTILDALEEINPRRSDGTRSVQIACIRLSVDEVLEPAELMETIVHAHGSGELTTVLLEELDP